jgi:hypothetical protein
MDQRATRGEVQEKGARQNVTGGTGRHENSFGVCTGKIIFVIF